MDLNRQQFLGFCAVLCIGVGSVLAGVAAAQTGGEKNRRNTAHKEELRDEFEKLRRTGFELIREKKWLEAHLLFEQVLLAQPEDALSYYGDALALFNLGRLPEAERGIREAVRLLSGKDKNRNLLADALVLSAVISATHKDNRTAIGKLQRALKIAPGHFDANLSLARTYYGEGNTGEAIRFFRRAVAIRPGDQRARFFLATALERNGDLAEALGEYRIILKNDPQNADGNLGLGVLLLKLEGDDSTEALAALRKAVAANENLYEAQITLGKTLLRLNRAGEAVGFLEKAIEISPDIPEPHYQLALAYRRLGKKKEAEKQMLVVKRIHERRRSGSDDQR